MPNHVYSSVSVYGTDEEIQNFFMTHFTEEDGGDSSFDFNTFIPMPDELHGTVSPSREPRDATEDQLAEWKANQTRLGKAYGADNWYDWCIQNWGTKWNSYDNHIADDSMSFSFQTAWSLPEPIFAKMAELYPTMRFLIQCVEEGGFFSGDIDIDEGEINDNVTGDEAQWKLYAAEFMGYDFEEEEQEERDDVIALIDSGDDAVMREVVLFVKENIDDFIKFSKN
jgi:hypothetical protein